MGSVVSLLPPRTHFEGFVVPMIVIKRPFTTKKLYLIIYIVLPLHLRFQQIFWQLNFETESNFLILWSHYIESWSLLTWAVQFTRAKMTSFPSCQFPSRRAVSATLTRTGRHPRGKNQEHHFPVFRSANWRSGFTNRWVVAQLENFIPHPHL